MARSVFTRGCFVLALAVMPASCLRAGALGRMRSSVRVTKARSHAGMYIPGTENWELNLGLLHYDAQQTQGLLYLAVLPSCAVVIRTINEFIPVEWKGGGQKGGSAKLTLSEAAKDPALWQKVLSTPAANRGREILLAEYAAKGKDPEEAEREVEEYLADPERSMDFLRKCTMAEVVSSQQGAKSSRA